VRTQVQMTEQEAARLNAKYPRFYLSRWSKSQGRHICVGKGYADIRNALKAAFAADARKPGSFTFIDVKA
jgi:hypothetical protein